MVLGNSGNTVILFLKQLRFLSEGGNLGKEVNSFELQSNTVIDWGV